MAANNYFGYTTGGTQFGATPAATYTTNPATAAAGYAAVQHAAQQYAAAPRASQAGYETYQTAATHQTTYQYGSRPQATYDKTQSYYPQSTAQVAYSTADTSHYQTGVTKSTYTMNTNPYGNTAQTRTTTQKAQNAGTTQAPATSYVYSTNTAAGSAAANYASYNAASTTSYPAAAMYAASQSAGAATTAVQGGAVINKTQTGTWGGGGFKKGFVKTQKIKAPPKPQQLHYCEVCKISCAGPQTYREHLEGQKHKKKEAAAKAGNPTPFSRGGASLRCELCDVTCTGQDAYAAHIRGSKHQKVVKLHTKLGKPIPSTDPVVLSTGTTTATSGKGAKQSPGAKAAGTTTEGKKVLGTPKINFVGGTKLKTIGADGATAATEEKKDSDDEDKDDTIDDKSDVQPVGQDYIDEIRNEEGKVISFQCKLCDCRFNDPNAKEMHMKGRRHRLQYKKKVNPDLVVDIKPSLRQRKIQEDRLRRQQIRDELWKRREEDRWREEMRMMEEEERMYWEERRRYEEEMEYYEWYRRYGRDPHMLPPPPMPRGPFMGPPMRGPQMMPPRRPDSVDDRHIMSKHTSIYPKEEELNNVQKVVLNTERALKQVSDFLAESDAPKGANKKEPVANAVKKEPTEEEAAATTNGEGGDKENAGPPQPERMMKGVMRVGILSKGLLLTGDGNVQLVVMCSEKPTRTLLDRVADNLPKQFAEICPDDKYEVTPCVEEAAIKVESGSDPKMTVTVTLTSPIMRDGADKDGESGESVKDPPDVLDRQKCLAALAALRHAKWFQARASGLQSCVMIIRIMRDLCQRVPTWGRISTWAMELLVEKVIGSSGQFLSPGDALRRVFEAVASGLLLPGGSGLLDPCEKEQVDAAAHLSNQDREDITASSQYALRLIAFRQIHKVLGMDPLPPPKFSRVPFTRKRRRDNSASEGNDSEGADGKKDKKDEKAGTEAGESVPAGTTVTAAAAAKKD